jgi:hypothetical protein
MQKLFGCVAMAAFLVAPATGAEAGELSLTIANGRVTLIAHDVTVRQILDEWARVGQTRIVNGDKLLGAPMTIELRDVTEAKALETVLRSAAGYLVAPRMAGATGTSFYDRILILPTSRPPAVTSAPPAQFNRFPPQPQPQPMPVVDDDEPAPGSVPPGMPQAGQPFPGPAPMPSQPGAQQPVNTLPRPGMLPPAPSGPANPYQPQPGVRPPGAPGGPGGGGTPVTRRGPGGGGSEGGI